MRTHCWRGLASVGLVTALIAAAPGTARAQPPGAADFSGLYRPAGLEVQPCGRNEWTRRNFDTDTFCNGGNDGFPFKPEGIERWKSFPAIEDPVLRCIEDFPRNAMRGRPMKVAIGKEVTEISYWFDNQWFVRTVHMNGKPPPADTPHTVTGYSTGRWSGDTLIVETTHTHGGPMYNDHKLNSPDAHFTERYWRAPDGKDLLMEMALDDPENYSKPFVLNRQEWIWAPDLALSTDKCEPSSIWQRRMQREAEEAKRKTQQ